MSDTDLDVESRLATVLRTAGGRGSDPLPDLEQVVGRARRRRTRTAATSALAMLLVATLAVVALASTDRSSHPHIRSGTEAPATPTVSTPAPPGGRPVLDQCAATQAEQMSAEGAPMTSPVKPFEMFADPSRGAVGPLAALARFPTPGGVSATDGNTGGLRANSDIEGRDLTVQPPADSTGPYGGSGSASWDLADGGNAILYTRGLDATEMRALVEALDHGASDLPTGLVPIGTAGHVEWSRSDCTHSDGEIAWVTTYRGDPPSRYAHVLLSYTGGSESIRDDGETTTFVVSSPGGFDAADATVRQATAEEWAGLIEAGKQAVRDAEATPPASVEPPAITAPR